MINILILTALISIDDANIYATTQDEIKIEAGRKRGKGQKGRKRGGGGLR